MTATFNTLMDLDLGELSMVDFPAQAPAVAHITKRKSLVELSPTPTPVKKDQEIKMTPDEQKALEDAKATATALAKAKSDLADVTKERDELAVHAARALDLSDEHRTFAKRLSMTDARAFVAKGQAERQATIEDRRGKEVYKRADGKVFYESDDPEIVAVWKHADGLAKSLESVTIEKSEAVLKAKVQKTLGNVGGTDAGKLAILKALAAAPLTDDERKAAEETLAKANSQCSLAFDRRSSNAGPTALDEESADSILEKKADEIAKRIEKDQKVPFYKAQMLAMETREYADLMDSLGNR